MLNINSFKKMKRDGEKIVMITAYDYPSGRLVERSKSDMILVGDSLGMVVFYFAEAIESWLSHQLSAALNIENCSSRIHFQRWPPW